MSKFISKMAIAILLMLAAAVAAYSADKQPDKQKTLIEEGVDQAKSLSSQAVEAATETANKIDTSSVTRQIYGDVKSAVTAIAEGLKVGAEHVYIILVRQSFVEAVIYTSSFILGIILIIICYKIFETGSAEARKRCREAKAYESSWSNYFAVHRVILGLLAGLFGLGVFVAGLCSIDTIAMGFINPEFGAIERILDIISNK